jgi:RNA polymerase sigma-70 factor, ECF subfamily
LPIESSSWLNEQQLNQLMERYQNGDTHAANELIERLSPFLLRFLRRAAFAKTDPNDLLQDCWLAVHAARHTFRPGSPVVPWIVAIARNLRADALRLQARTNARQTQLDQADGSPGGTPAAHNDLVAMLHHLPANQIQAVMLTKVIGYSLEEAAEVAKITVGALKQRLSRAYMNLRRIATERGRTS